jgi:hypothetical protein
MKTRASLGDIIFLVVVIIALVLLWHFLSPSTWFVLSCLGLGAAYPVLVRLGRVFVPRSLQSLPFILILCLVLPAYERFPAVPYRSVVFFATYFAALAVGLCIVEFSLRPFFPLKPREKDA